VSAVGTPVVFIHGLWLHATSWTPWVELFAERGYAPVAPGWPGEPDTVAEARANPDLLANRGIDEVTEHYVKIIEGLDRPPVLVGHSFGGLIAQKLLGLDHGAAAVAGRVSRATSIDAGAHPHLRGAPLLFDHVGATMVRL
jgi:non-heme chloroperoxidase